LRGNRYDEKVNPTGLNMIKTKSLLVTLLTLSQFGALGAEVDSFTNRFNPLDDSLVTINKQTNIYFQEALDLANKKGDGCEEKVLYRSLRKYFGNQYRSKFGKYVVEAENFDAHRFTIPNTIYRNFNWYESPIQGFWGRVVSDPTAPTLNVNGVIIGTDKFEHFLGSGFLYFKKNYLEGKGVQAALNIGYRAETGIMGAWMTGVKAFGDLSANFNGMRFWNHVLQKNDDILGKQENHGPYVTCTEIGWEQVKKVDWATYIDESFDEGNNCSQFPKEKILNKVLTEISIMEEETGLSHTCPINPEKLDAVTAKYGEIGKQILNFKGHSVIDKDDRIIIEAKKNEDYNEEE
jgi:hypothetical protein